MRTLSHLFGRSTAHFPRTLRLISVEALTLCYLGLSMAIALVFSSRMPLTEMFIARGTSLIVMGSLIGLYYAWPCRATLLVRYLFPFAGLGTWYGETYRFNLLWPNLDPWFSQLEQNIFGGQPSLWLPEWLNSIWWSEAFNFGYWAYYVIIVTVLVGIYFDRFSRFEKSAFIALCSFYLFYLVYLFVPVTGPQYYFQAVGLDTIVSGVFPNVGDYFQHHNVLLPTTDYGGFFMGLVEQTQARGEYPTAAFPSSHVGVSTVMMMLAYRWRKGVFWGLMPIYILLCISTVYTQAHYAIDAFAGFIAGYLIYRLSEGIRHKRYPILAY
ncbi:MAG: phosphatase PAP2 family protein [Bacteroidales bacterium]|nr:phosphatase PAP2 family protein [Bacteroidales bacterium]